MKSLGKLFILLGIGVVAGAFFYFDLGQYLTLSSIKSYQGQFAEYYQQNKLLTIGIFFTVYVISTAVSLPGAALLTLLGGALFGLLLGTLIVSFASTIGATLAFLVSRFLLGDWVGKKFSSQLTKINSGIDKEGAFYLFTLRLVPLVPFFIINLAMGLTRMKTFTFYIVSQLGMFFGTMVYVNAGTELGKIENTADIISPSLLLSFAILGLAPLLANKLLSFIKSRKVYKAYKKPKRYDYNVIAIGAGAGGLVTSYITAAAQGKVALIEKHKMGGDCLNTGCVPSKALIRTAKFIKDTKNSASLGIKSTTVDFEFSEVMERVHRVIKKIEPHDSVERYTGLGVDCIQGAATIKSPWEVEVNGKVLTTKNIVIATGARPFVPPIPGINDVSPLTSDNLWDIKELPKNLLVLGGGAIGSELAQSFARLGSNVTQMERSPRIMPREDEDVSEEVQKHFAKDGVKILTSCSATQFTLKDGKKVCVYTGPEGEKEIIFDQVIVAVGRAANTKGFGLEELGVEISSRGTVQVNEKLQTNFPNIYACGDVAGPYQFTHTAAHQAWFCAVNSMLRPFYSFNVDYSTIPWCTYTAPEVARVGLSEQEAKEQNIEYRLTKYGIDDLDRAIADEVDYGFVKVLTPLDSDKILGATIVGAHAGDIITEFILAKKYGLGLGKILGTIHIYPTFGEANKYAAGVWKKATVSERSLAWARKFQNWQRG